MTRPGRLATNAVIVLCLGLQLAGFGGNVAFPFVPYDMYRKAIPPGPIAISRTRLWGTTLAGERVRFRRPESLGIPSKGFRRKFIEPIAAGSEAVARELANLANRDRDDPIIRIEVRTKRTELVDGNIEEAPPQVLTFEVPVT